MCTFVVNQSQNFFPKLPHPPSNNPSLPERRRNFCWVFAAAQKEVSPGMYGVYVMGWWEVEGNTESVKLAKASVDVVNHARGEKFPHRNNSDYPLNTATISKTSLFR